MKTAIVATGSELIRGFVQDINSRFLARNLTELGFENQNIFICGDQKETIKESILRAAKIADLIFITGGLGPTKDDQTKNAFAEALDLELEYSTKIEKNLTKIFKSSNLNQNNLSQAYIPQGSKVINNNFGTAPALKLKNKNNCFYLLPGVPSELKYLFREKIISDLKSLSQNKFLVKELNFIGIGEANLAAKVENLALNPALEISYQAGQAEVKLRIKVNSASQKSFKQKNEIVNKARNKLKKEFSCFIYGEDNESLEAKIKKILIKKKLKVATAESFTGGLLAKRLTKLPGSSEYFLGSIVAYNQEIKEKLLKLKQSFLKKYGVVSQECVEAMAVSAANIFSSDLALASSGAAGPAAHADQKAGIMFISIFYQGQSKTFKIEKNYGRAANTFYASQIALFELYKLIAQKRNDLNA